MIATRAVRSRVAPSGFRRDVTPGAYEPRGLRSPTRGQPSMRSAPAWRRACWLVAPPAGHAVRLPGSAALVIGEDVVSRLHDRVAPQSTLGVVPLRRHVGCGAGREGAGRRAIVERGPSPPTAVCEPLAVLHHEVDVMLRARHGRGGEGVPLFLGTNA